MELSHFDENWCVEYIGPEIPGARGRFLALDGWMNTVWWTGPGRDSSFIAGAMIQEACRMWKLQPEDFRIYRNTTT